MKKHNNNYAQGISSTTVFLERFFENLLFQGKPNSNTASAMCSGKMTENAKVQIQSAKIALWMRPPCWRFWQRIPMRPKNDCRENRQVGTYRENIDKTVAGKKPAGP